ncbi:hypothetical protein AAH446_00860 [Erwinia sp. P6884]|uniref:hypothetical protein n=1 Tax=Erwinia sp. P6884 TaxID=3141450 RepID=UPI0031979B42
MVKNSGNRQSDRREWAIIEILAFIPGEPAQLHALAADMKTDILSLRGVTSKTDFIKGVRYDDYL